MAVQWMDPMSHTELLDFLPQLVQVSFHLSLQENVELLVGAETLDNSAAL